MFEILSAVVFFWLFWKVLKLVFKLTWGAAKIVAVLLTVLALPVFGICLLLSAGVLLLIPLGLIAIACGVVKACV